MNEWQKYKFSDFVKINPTVSLRGFEKYSFVEMKDLHDGNKFCFPSAMRKPVSGAKFENGDTLFAKITPCLENGKICQVQGLKNGIGFGSTEFFVFRGIEHISNNEFVFYLSRWDEVRAFAESNFEGTSGRQRVPKNCFDNFTLDLPSINEQSDIAEILSSLDDKIDLLYRQNKTLEQLAETLFRQWFVEEADESWKTAKVSDIASINKRTLRKDLSFNEIEYLDTGSITQGKIESFQKYLLREAPSRAQRVVIEDDIVYSLVRPIQKHFGLLHNVKSNTIVSTGFCVITCEKIIPYFIYILLTQNEVIDFFEMVAEGSTSAYPSLKPSDIADLEFQVPPQHKLEEFAKITENHWNKIKSNTSQIHNLTLLRDTLLPKLMNGEIRVKYNDQL